MSRERGTNFMSWDAPALTNGLETRLPPNKIAQSFSPDLNNVVLNDGAVSKRGGFTPFVREHPKLNSILNRGFRRSATVKTSGSATALNVPGRLLAGDRSQYDNAGAVTLDFFLRVDDLSPSTALATLESSTNDRYGGIADGRVKISCRPIISKGPSKRAVLLQRDPLQQYADRYGPDTTAKGFCAWDPTATWGPGASFHAATCTSAGTASGNRQFTTRQPHGISNGDQVFLYGSVLAGAALSYDFVYTATVISPTIVQFSLANASTNGEEVTLVTEPATVGHALPWAVYLWNEGTVDVADFKFEFATVGRDLGAGEYVLKRLQSTIDVVEGSIYHVLASVDWTDRMVLRIGRWDTTVKSFIYTANELDLSGDGLSPPLNPVGPIQVFDIPIEFAEIDSANQDIWDAAAFTSRPPGLGLAELTNGGYFSEVKRFEGAIEDIAIWNTALSGTNDGTRDRDTKLDVEEVNASQLLNFWPMTDGGQRVIREATGRGNHLYFAPDFPILDEESGGIRSDRRASWWFNGATSYALCDLDGNPNWRERRRYDEDEDRELLGSWSSTNSARAGWLQQNILSGGDIGLHVEFQLDALEPFEQVLAEIHGVMRCAIRPDGRLQLYYRDKGSATRPFVHSYIPLVYSSLVVKPGERYAVQFAISEGKAVIAVNGAIDASVTFSSTTDPETHPVGGLTIGMGSRRFTISGDKRDYAGFSVAAGVSGSQITIAGSDLDIDVGDIINISSSSLGNNGDYIVTKRQLRNTLELTPRVPFGGADTGTVRVKSVFQASRLPAPVNGINTDFRSGFLGRIELVKVLAGRSLELITSVRDEDSGNWKFPIVPLYRVPDVASDTTNTPPYQIQSRDTVTPTDFTTNPGGVIAGQGVRVQGVTNLDDQDRERPDLRYNVFANIGSANAMQPAIPSLAGVENARASFDLFYVIGHWSLDRSFDDTNIIGGRFANGIEQRQRTPDTLDSVLEAAEDFVRFVARQQTPIEDDTGNLGPLEARCIEPDILTEAEDHRVIARSLSAPTREFSFVRGRVWQEFSPREIGPRWSEGLVLPNLDDSRISLIADMDDQRTGERFVFTAVGRNLYWAKQIWRDDSPFPDDSGSVWLFGQPGEHIIGESSSQTQRLGATLGSYSPINSEMWVKPQRLDGVRVLWGVCDPMANIANRINYLVGTYNGAIFVCGTLNNAAKSWFYFEGTNGTSSFISRDDWLVTSTSLRIQEWNHVHVVVGTAGGVPLRVFVNGSPVRMSALNGNSVPFVGFTPDGLTTSDTPDISQRMFIGGLPEGYEQFKLTTTAVGSPLTSRVFKVQSWHGMLTEFRSAPEIDSRFPLSGAGTVPQARYTSSAGTGYHMSLGSKRGWVFKNTSPGLASDSAQSQIKEMILVADDLGDSRFDRYDSAVFRDALYITNGVGRMQEVRFRRFSHPSGPFSCHNAGMIQPTPAVSRVSMEIGPPTSLLERWGGNPRAGGAAPLEPLTDIQPPEVMQPGVYQLYVAFVDDRGRESEPALLDTITVTGLAPVMPEGTRTTTVTVANNAGKARFTSSVNHGLSLGDSVEILGFGSEYDGIHRVINVPGVTQFDLDLPFGGTGFNHVPTGGLSSGGWMRSPPAATPVIDLFNDASGDIWLNFGGGWNPYSDENIPTTPARRFRRPRAGEYMTIRVVTGTSNIPAGWYALRSINRGTTVVWAFPGSENSTLNVGSGGGSLTIQVYPSSFYIDRLPRSTEPHVVARRIYVSPSGGGVPVRALDVLDNVTDSVTVTGPGPIGALGIELGRKLVPPKARLVAVDQGRMVIANLTDLDAGRSAFAWSDSTEVTYWPLPNTAVLDSENGESIIGLGSTLGNFYLSKRNSIWAFEPSTPSIRAVNQSVGVGGGLTLYDNLMIGSGERGVYAFDGSNVIYTSSSLEGEWSAGVPVTDRDLLNHFGAFHRDESQWWLSARAPTKLDGTALPMRANRRIWVLHTQSGDNQSWTRLTVPPHTFMRGVTDPVSQRPEILIGCADGRLLRYDREVFIDGQNDEPGASQLALGLTQNALIGGAFSGGALVLAKVTGKVIDFSPLLGVLGFLDTIQGGLRGMQLLLISTAFLPTIARVRSNTATTITLDVDTGATNADVLFELGSYDAYYSTPWVVSRPSKTIVAKNYALEFEATEADLVVRWSSAIQTAQDGVIIKPEREWSPPVFGSDTISLRRGFQAQHGRFDEANRGRYFRMWLGTTPSALSLAGNSTLGIRNPWTVQTISFDYTEEDGGFV